MNSKQEKVSAHSDSDSVYSFSDDERTPFQDQPFRKARKSRSNIYFICLVLGNIILGALYAGLWIRHIQLKDELRKLEPELFPCKSLK